MPLTTTDAVGAEPRPAGSDASTPDSPTASAQPAATAVSAAPTGRPRGAAWRNFGPLLAGWLLWGAGVLSAAHFVEQAVHEPQLAWHKPLVSVVSTALLLLCLTRSADAD